MKYIDAERLREEVDLENEIGEYFQGWRDGEDFYQALNAEGECVSVEDVIGVARHFYELGLKRNCPLCSGTDV